MGARVGGLLPWGSPVQPGEPPFCHAPPSVSFKLWGQPSLLFSGESYLSSLLTHTQPKTTHVCEMFALARSFTPPKGSGRVLLLNQLETVPVPAERRARGACASLASSGPGHLYISRETGDHVIRAHLPRVKMQEFPLGPGALPCTPASRGPAPHGLSLLSPHCPASHFTSLPSAP